jgi:hypothetical protein
LRDEYINRLRGIEPGVPFDAAIRGQAIMQMQEQESELLNAAQKSKGRNQPLAFPFWTSIGMAALFEEASVLGGLYL